MNKFTIAVALVAVFVGMVAANKLHHKSAHLGGEHEFGEHELEHDIVEHKPFRGGHRHLESDGEFVHRHPHHLRKNGLSHGGRGRGAVKGAGVGAIAGAGIRHEGEFDAGIHAGHRLGSHKSAEGHKGFVAGTRKDFNAGANQHDLSDNEAHNRHSVVNKNKLIVKESDTGFNDDVGFHNRNEHSNSGHIGGSEGKLIGGKAGGKLVSNKNFESEHDAGLHAGTETDAGIGGAVGAGVADVE